MQSSFAMRVAALVALSGLVAGCGGGGGSITPPSSTSTSQNAATANAALTLTIPAASTTSARSRQYVSASTQSIKVMMGTTSEGSFDTTPASPGCSASGGATNCSFNLTLPLGTDTLTITAYDKTGATGNTLSTSGVTLTVAAGTKNVIPTTMSGTVASVVVSISDSIPAGTAANVPVVVMAKDAAGNVIIGATPYGTPILLADDDSSGITKLAVNGGSAGTTASVNAPSDLVTLVYSGKNFTSATITPSALGASTAPAYFRPKPTQLALYPFPAPAGMVGEPGNITVGSDGQFWMSYYAWDYTHGQSYSGIASMTTSGAYAVYQPGTAPSTNLLNAWIPGIAGAPAGSSTAAWFTQSQCCGTAAYIGSITTAGAVTEYMLPATTCASGNRSPGNIISDGSTGYWFTIDCNSGGGDQVGHIASDGTIALSSQITGFRNSYGIVLGKDGNLYVAGSDGTSNGVVVKASVSGTSIGSTTSVSTNIGNNTHWYGVTQSSDGDLWLTTDSCTPSAMARLHPAATFSSSTVTLYPTAQGCAYPALLTALPDNSMWVPQDNWAEVTQIIPTPNQGVPTINNILVQNSNTVFGDMWQAVLGPDGNLYFTDYDYGCCGSTSQSGEVVKFAY